MSPRAIVDLFKLPEDERITVIVDCIRTGGRIGILLEDEKLAPGKIERYIRKVKERVVGVSAEITDGPVANVSLVTFIKGK
jgi:hypothetical protein